MKAKKPSGSTPATPRPRREPTTAKRTKADNLLDHICPALRPLAKPIAQLHDDGNNARRHDERNLAAITASLRQFGQQAPVVYVMRDGRKTVIKGNGVLAAAQALGWKHLAAVRSDLAAHAAIAYAIADNRTTDLSEFDAELLAAQLQELEEAEFDIEAAGFDAQEVDELSRIADEIYALRRGHESPGPPPPADGPDGTVAAVRETKIIRPPSMTWVLIGVPTVRWGEVSAAAESLADVPGAVCRVKVQDDR